MPLFKRREKAPQAFAAPPALAAPGRGQPVPGHFAAPPTLSGDLCRALREAVPVIDAAVYKLVRLAGGFRAVCENRRYQGALDAFSAAVPSDGANRSLQTFADCYFEQLLTYGTAVAEMVPDETGAVRYLYNAPPHDFLLRRARTDFSRVEVLKNDGAFGRALPHPERFVYAALAAQPGELYGVPALSGLAFVSSVLLKIFNAVGQNWERVGNVRFAVTYKPSGDPSARAYAKERAAQIAEQWGEAMRSREVRDFVAVGDVDVKVIGADNQILDSEVPVRQLLEQIVAKLGLPPYMLGLSWSTTERMAAEQADILTTELEYYRRVLSPVLQEICRTHLRALGCTDRVDIVWDDITLKDAVAEATARHLDAQTAEIRAKLGLSGEEGDKNAEIV